MVRYTSFIVIAVAAAAALGADANRQDTAGGVPASSERAPAARTSREAASGAVQASGGGVPASSER